MMSAVLAWLRRDVRRRWRSLGLLAVLISIAAAAVMTAVAGAQRGASAVDRLLDQTVAATVLVQPFATDFDWDAARALPGVAALGELAFSGYEIDGRPAEASMVLPPADADTTHAVERPVVLDGRLPDPARADEVVITSNFATSQGKWVGDTVAIGLYTPEQVDIVQGPDSTLTNLDDSLIGLYTPEQLEAALAAGWDINDTAPAEGPVVEATIVGVVRSFWFSDRLDSPGHVIPSAALYAEHASHFRGAEGLAATGALVRLDGGSAAIPDFRNALSELAGRSDVFVGDLTASARDVRNVARFEATSLLAVALAGGVAAVLLVGVAVARYTASALPDLRLLQAVGMTRRQALGAAAIGPAIAAVAGAAAGAAIAVVASRWFPIGSAAPLEPNPGPRVDVGVVAAGLIGVPLVAAGGAAAVAALALRVSGTAASSRRSAVATAAAAAGLPVAVVLGARFALEPGRGRQAVPVRPALLGATAGITGLLAALTFSHAVDDAATNAARFGFVNDIEAWVGFNNLSFAPAEAVFEALAATQGVAGVHDVVGHLAEAGDRQVLVLSAVQVGTPSEFIVTAGRRPLAPAETLLGLRAADALGAGLGDTVTLSGTVGEAELLVVGLGVVDAVDASAMTTRETYHALFGESFMMRYGDLGLEPGADFAEVMPLLHEALAAVPGASPDNVGILPQGFDEDDIPPGLRFLRPLPVFLAGFLVVLALGAVGYALTAAVRRRSYDVAVLRALGMGRGEARGVVATQAAVIALVGLGLGVPLGVALGRVVWRYIADTMFIHYVPPVAVVALVVLGPAVFLAAILLSAWPGRRVATMRVADVLRAE